MNKWIFVAAAAAVAFYVLRQPSKPQGLFYQAPARG